MKYDIQLGMLATQAMSELIQAAAQNDFDRYRRFLQASAEFCESIRESSPPFALGEAGPQEATAFISAVIKISGERSSERDRDRLRTVTALEPLIQELLRENRPPNEGEQLQIAEMLYAASAADFS